MKSLLLFISTRFLKLVRLFAHANHTSERELFGLALLNTFYYLFNTIDLNDISRNHSGKKAALVFASTAVDEA